MAEKQARIVELLKNLEQCSDMTNKERHAIIAVMYFMKEMHTEVMTEQARAYSSKNDAEDMWMQFQVAFGTYAIEGLIALMEPSEPMGIQVREVQ